MGAVLQNTRIHQGRRRFQRDICQDELGAAGRRSVRTRTGPDSHPYQVYDVVMLVTGCDRNQAGEKIRKIFRDYSELNNKTKVQGKNLEH